MGKRRSTLQKAHSLGQITAIHTRKRENIPTILAVPSSQKSYLDSYADISSRLVHLENRASDLSQKLRNTLKREERAKKTIIDLRRSRRKLVHLSAVQKSRAVTQKENAVKRALNTSLKTPGELRIKDTSGAVTTEAREMLRDLTALNVPIKNIGSVVKVVAEGFGMELKDNVSKRTVARTMKEAGVASDLQMMYEIKNSKGIVLSGDGTTIRHRNVETQHGAWMAKSYKPGASEEPQPVVRTFGIRMAPDHTSETQLHSWKSLSQSLRDTYNDSPLGKSDPVDQDLFASSIIGTMTDHASDQKKLSHCLKEWKMTSIRALKGRTFMESSSLQDLLPLIAEELDAKLKRVGGLDSWNKLSDIEKEREAVQSHTNLCLQFGDAAWAALSQEDRRDASLFVRAGCCMHKEMNATKYGAEKLTRYWTDNNIVGPVKLMNRANAAAAGAGKSKAQDIAIEASQGGAVKLTSLAGAVLHHRDDKKGQQDTYRIYFEDTLGFQLPRFPDTSNTRFGSHAAAAAELLAHLPIYLDFFLHICDKKETRSLNHMESNVYKGLLDLPTQTELAVFAFYSLVITYPYMRAVRAPGKVRVNAINLAPLHKKVRAHCTKIAVDPSILLAPDASYQTACLDGKVWERPEVFYAIQRLAPTLPHLKGCIVAFFEGATSGWDQFTEEFNDDGIITGLTQTEKKRIFIPATNDHCEGHLGKRRRALQHAPTMTVSFFNAKSTYTSNETKGFIRTQLTGEEHEKFLRKTARERDASGEEQAQRIEQARHDKRIVEVKREKDRMKLEKHEEAERELDGIEPILDPKVLQSKAKDRTFTAPLIVQQINWHRRFVTIVLSRTLVAKMSREEKLTHLIVLVEAYNRLPRPVTRLLVPKRSVRRMGDVVCKPDWEEVEAAEDEDMVEV